MPIVMASPIFHEEYKDPEACWTLKRFDTYRKALRFQFRHGGLITRRQDGMYIIFNPDADNECYEDFY